MYVCKNLPVLLKGDETIGKTGIILQKLETNSGKNLIFGVNVFP